MKFLRRLFRVGLIFVAVLTMVTIIVDRHVSCSTQSEKYDQLSDLPYNRVGLFLGTGKYLANGRINHYYRYRIDAALALFHAGKVDYILVSGDNSRKTYDEPTTIKNDLVAGGVPVSRIALDYAGFRTFDSVVRSKKVFNVDSVTIISQAFHNERALYLAKKFNITAVAFNAKGVSKRYGFRTQLREKLARVKMMLDLLFGKDPKFLGAKIYI